jgi:outer membrane protein
MQRFLKQAGLVIIGLFWAVAGWAESSNESPNGTPGETQAVDLSQWLDWAERYNGQLAAQRASVTASRFDQDAADASLGPSVRLKSELSYRVMEKADFARSANRLEVTQPLYQPELSARQTLAQTRTAQNLARLGQAKLQVLTDMANAVIDRFEVRVAQRYLQREAQALADIQNQLSERVSLGQRSHSDWAEVQAQRSQNRVRQARNRQAQAEVTGRIDALLEGLPASEKALLPQRRLDWQGSLTHIEQHRPAAWRTMASEPDWQQWVEAHPDLVRLNHQGEQMQAKVALARSANAPKVEAFGGWVYNESDDYFYDDMQGALGGVRLEWPFYRHGETRARMASARSERQQAITLRRQRQAELMAKASEAWQNLAAQHALLEAVDDLLQARENRVQSLSQYLESGRGSTLDLLAAQLDRYRAERDALLAQAGLLRQWVKLASATGHFEVMKTP